MKTNINELTVKEFTEFAKENPGHIEGKGDGTIVWVSETCSECGAENKLSTYIDVPGDPKDFNITLCHYCAKEWGLND